ARAEGFTHAATGSARNRSPVSPSPGDMTRVTPRPGIGSSPPVVPPHMETLASHPALAVDGAVTDLLFREARTVNAFAPDEVPEELVHAAYDLTRWGPTAMNTSPLRYAIVRQGEARE